MNITAEHISLMVTVLICFVAFGPSAQKKLHKKVKGVLQNATPPLYRLLLQLFSLCLLGERFIDDGCDYDAQYPRHGVGKIDMEHGGEQFEYGVCPHKAEHEQADCGDDRRLCGYAVASEGRIENDEEGINKA